MKKRDLWSRMTKQNPEDPLYQASTADTADLFHLVIYDYRHSLVDQAVHLLCL